MFVYKDKCIEFGLDPAKVKSIARRISSAAKEADKIGLTVFNGTLRYQHAPLQGPGHSEVAMLDGEFDGGEGCDVY